ncbi:MAG TPA: autotransporter strand-loop-strand O-heptosyltransferase [Acetobacteraceae bacterium]|nr:autotransporter strand-loop-strand O-heptosyltransferase [Acetobacteraceae bacterium]
MDITPAETASALPESASPAPAPVSAGTSSGGPVSAGDPSKRAYPAPAGQPTQLGPKGIRFDFNEGCRVLLPPGEKPWRVVLRDLDTGNVLFRTDLASGAVNSTKRYYVRFRIEVSQDSQPVLTHDFDAAGREVLVLLPVGTLGDTVGWLPYAIKFQRRHTCKLTLGIAERLIPLFAGAYPEISFVPHESVKVESYYATYYVGLFFDDEGSTWQPSDFRLVGLHRTAGYILGVDPTEEPPALSPIEEGRPIAEPYVVIATQSTTQCKTWNNPYGWRDIIQFLKQHGYRVICIDQKPVHGTGLVWNHLPHGAEDETGDRTLLERVRWMKHAAFFVGLSSGLSWLAWAVGTPVVMISGFTHPTNEFTTPYRVINYHTCNSCWNDVRQRFDHKDFLWCPRHAGTARQFECTRLITAEQVKDTIRRIPGFGVHAA